VTQFCAPPPFLPCTTDLDCASLTGQCVTGACNPWTGECFAPPKPKGTPCDDNRACSVDDSCDAGVCKAKSYASCPCAQTGDEACGPGLTCCGGSGGSGACVDLSADPTDCGACGIVCSPDRTCSGGACVAAPAVCAAPSASTITGLAAQIPGADAIAFDRPGNPFPNCFAYVSAYRYPTASRVQRIDPLGVVVSINSPSPDLAPLNGIAVAQAGDQVFATAVNRPAGLVPQTQPALIEGTFSSGHLNVALTTVPTLSGTPFALGAYDQGPVGPAFDYQAFAGGSSDLYFGNWASNGDVYEVIRPCASCPWTANQVPVAITPAGDRITAIAFERAKNPGPGQGHRSLYIGHGKTLTIVDLDTAAQSDIDLSAGEIPPVVAILSIAVHPVYGEVYLEVKNSTAQRFLLDVDAHDHSSRHASVDQADQHQQPIMPPTFPNDGRLVVTPSGELMRFIPQFGLNPLKVESYRVTK
jgi:hypothetical protein